MEIGRQRLVQIMAQHRVSTTELTQGRPREVTDRTASRVRPARVGAEHALVAVGQVATLQDARDQRGRLLQRISEAVLRQAGS
jgi:hypothetical protein